MFGESLAAGRNGNGYAALVKGGEPVSVPSVKEMKQRFDEIYGAGGNAGQMPPNVAIETFAQVVAQVAMASDYLRRQEQAIPRDAAPAAVLGRAAAMLQSLNFDEAAEHMMQAAAELNNRTRGAAGFKRE